MSLNTFLRQASKAVEFVMLWSINKYGEAKLNVYQIM
jgi:hypothetical protein